MSPTCPTPQALASYLAGRMPPHHADEIDEHLQYCQRCVELAERAQGGRDALMQAIAVSVPHDSLTSEPELAAALAAIQGYSTSTDDQLVARDASTARLVRDYQLLDKLGEGGMGTVYRALHTRLEKVVALKILKPDRQQQAQAVQRFEREMRALGSLEHPNIVRALDAGEANGTHFLVMEFIEGIDLARLVQRVGPLAIADACELVRQAALGLAHAHQHEKVHRDVKPANLMLSGDGVVKVLDLGLAQLRSPLPGGDELTREDQVMGTRAYMSPEQLLGAKNVTHSTDIYSLGVTLYHLLAGEIPLKPGQFAVHLPPLEQLRAAVPGPVKQIVQAMLCRTADDRVASMSSVASLLEPHAAGANLSNLLRRFDDSRFDAHNAQRAFGEGLGPVSFALPSALQPTEPFQTTDRRPPTPPPLPPPVTHEAPPARNKAMALLLAASGIAAVLALAVALLFWPSPVADGKLTLRDDRPAARDGSAAPPADVFVVPVMAEGDDEKVEPIRLAVGDNALPAGEYRLHNAAPGLVVQVNGAAAPPSFFVRAEQPTLIALSTLAARGVLHLQVGHELMDEVLNQHDGPGIFVLADTAQDQTDAIRLRAGENDLPAGEYRLLTPAWMFEFTVNGQPMSPTLVIKPDRPLFVRGTARTDFPWNLPEIPQAEGAFAEAYGTLWRASAAGDAQELTYHLRLTVRNETQVENVPHRWLEVEVTTSQGGEKFVERGWLLINADRYREHHELRVARGWIEAQTAQLQEQLASLFPEEPPTSLVATFDSQHDALAALAERQNLLFPVDRVSVQEAMALLFEADFVGGLPPAVQELRPKLAAVRSLHFESVDGPFGAEACLVVRAQIANPASPTGPPLVRYELQRAEDVPFSFMAIEVVSPVLRGKFVLKDYKRQVDAASLVAVDETRLARWAEIASTGPSARQRFDIVSLPEAGGAKSCYSGRLVAPAQFFDNHATQRSETTIDYDVDLWVGEAEVVGDVRWRPLAVVVTSGPSGRKDCTERAWLWIDDRRYRERPGLTVDAARSFVEISGDVFAYHVDHETLIDDLHRLGSRPPTERIGIYDALALLCDAGHPAAQKFNELRAELAAAIIATGKPRTNEPIKLRLDDGAEVWGERWEPPLTEMVYRIDRAERHLPFGMHTVFLQVPALRLEFMAELKSSTERDGQPLVEGDRWWEQHARQTAARIAAIKPGNFRLWKRADNGVIVWGEYLADGHGEVALRDAAGRIVTAKIDTLAHGQQADMRVREWRNRAGDKSFKAEFKGVEGNRWRLWIVAEGKMVKVDPLNYSAADNQWVADQSKAREMLPK